MTAALLAVLELFSPYRASILAHGNDLIAESRRAGIDPVVTAAIISRESAWNASALGKLGEIGLMQVKPDGDAARLCQELLDDLWTPATNLRCGLRLLRSAFQRCTYLPFALSRYNGSTCKRTAYSAKVMSLLPLPYWLLGTSS